MTDGCARRGTKLAAVLVTAAVWIGLLASAAAAQTAPAVTLEASATRIAIGQSVTLSGSVSPAAADETVELRDAADAVVVTATSQADGTFSIELRPEANLALHAVWNGASSGVVTVRVAAIVRVRLSGVRLFATAVVTGTVRPAQAGEPVRVTVLRGGRTVVTATPALRADGSFRTTFTVEQVGAYRVRARFVDDDHAAGSDTSRALRTRLPSLHVGSHGPFVALLERRLVELHYRLVDVDDRFDYRTADAVMAFRKVQGMTRVFTVDAGVWRRLADPFVPRPRVSTKAFHIEVDQTRQVLYAVRRGEIDDIIHVSTGKPSTPTRDGTFQVTRKIAGFSPNHLYYPSYFDGNRAIHGWTEVPTYAASHGCVRVPYWHALWIYGLAKIGTRVIVYH